VLIQQFFSASTFGIWLTSEGSSLFGFSGPVLGLLFGFLFGFPIFAIIGWLNHNELSLDKDQKYQKKYFSNYGIIRSLKNSALTSLVVWIILGGLYGFYIWIETNSFTGFLKGISEGFGVAIITALWFGGAEFIQHWSIRLTLYVYGDTPFFWNKYIKYGKSLTFLRQTGANYSFYHRTLKDYFSQKSIDENNIQRINNRFIGQSLFVVVILAVFYSVYIDIGNKFYKTKFWQSSNAQPIFNVQDTVNLKKINSGTFGIRNSGKLKIKAKGKFKIGTFSGYIKPTGTEVGFLGMPIGDKYDSVAYLPHGSLLYKLRSTNKWDVCFDNSIFLLTI
jgi:magnesium-transporting ATPase (P-type)